MKGDTSAPVTPGATGAAIALVMALRPRQWVKNGLVFLPLVFAINLAWSPADLAAVPSVLFKVALAAVAFCALSGAVYLFNDLLDREADRRHPVKRGRPLASGRVTAPVAVAVMAVCGVAGVAMLGWMAPSIGAIGLLYLALNGAYSLGLKRVAVVDVLLVASGYVIRTVTGALAVGVVPSPWLYTTTGAAALFIVLGKRFAEARLAGDNQGEQRPVLLKYPIPFAGQLLNISAATALVSYALYTIEAANLPDNNAMLLTIPLVTFGLFRFLFLLHTSPEAEYPEILIVKDLPMLISIVAWLALAGVILVWDGMV